MWGEFFMAAKGIVSKMKMDEVELRRDFREYCKVLGSLTGSPTCYIENILLNGEGALDQSLLGIVFISPGVLLPLIQFSRKFPRLLLQDQKRHLAARLLTFPRLSMEKPELSTVQKVICRYARNLKVIRESLIICNHYPPILQVVTTCQRGRSGCGLCS